MGNCCGREGDSGHETVLVRHKVARPETDRVIFTIDRYMSLTDTLEDVVQFGIPVHQLKI